MKLIIVQLVLLLVPGWPTASTLISTGALRTFVDLVSDILFKQQAHDFQGTKVIQLTTTSASSNLSFFEAAAFCNNASAGYGLPFFTETQSGALAALGDFLPALQVVDDVPLGINIRHSFDLRANESSDVQKTEFTAAWELVLKPFGIDIPPDTQVLGSDGEIQACLLYTSSQAVKAASCESRLTGRNLLCFERYGYCDGTEKQPLATASMGPGAVVSLPSAGPYEFWTNVTYVCDPQISVLENTGVKPEATCFGSLGWVPSDMPECLPIGPSCSQETGKTTKLDLGSVTYYPSTTFTGRFSEAAGRCFNQSSGSSGLINISSKNDFEALVSFIEGEYLCFEGEMPLANNILQAFPDGSVTNQSVRNAWATAIPLDVPFSPESDPSRWDNTTGRCATLKHDTSQTNARFVVSFRRCNETFHISSLFCQIAAQKCGPPPLPILVGNASGGQSTGASEFNYGTDVSYKCPFGAIGSGRTLKCFGSFGWFPQFPCQWPKICQYDGQSYAVIQGLQQAGIVSSATACYRYFNGSLFEHRTRVYTNWLLGNLTNAGCRPPAGWMYVAPSAWSHIREKKGLNLTTDAFNALWAYTDGTTAKAEANIAMDRPQYEGEVCAYAAVSQDPSSQPVHIGDIECWGTLTSLCVVNSAKTGCPPPINPTGSELAEKAVMEIEGNQENGIYPFGTRIKYQCPAPFPYWSQSNDSNILEPGVTINNKTIQPRFVSCLGTLGWGYYNITTCQARE